MSVLLLVAVFGLAGGRRVLQEEEERWRRQEREIAVRQTHSIIRQTLIAYVYAGTNYEVVKFLNGPY